MKCFVVNDDSIWNWCITYYNLHIYVKLTGKRYKYMFQIQFQKKNDQYGHGK